ncbi:chromate transporter [Legionella santicrucis]|uniref:chromate transporter n=1 Tax=Legionella santicrucis TaxID=45074 RepID=UPI001ED9B335|nr:chromate transporter [Legionella santicrucis]
MPGPLFTFAVFLGAVSTNIPHRWLGAVIALVAIFLPSFLLIIGTLPLWKNLRQHPSMQRAIPGINASVVGLLLTAFYQSVWSSAIFSLYDYLLAITAFLLLQFWRAPAWVSYFLCSYIANLISNSIQTHSNFNRIHYFFHRTIFFQFKSNFSKT